MTPLDELHPDKAEKLRMDAEELLADTRRKDGDYWDDPDYSGW